MIRHSPAGRGHAYRPSLDQRVPVVPTVDDRIEVRALVDGDVDTAWLEVRDDGSTRDWPAHPTASRGTDGDDADGGHLAAAAAAGESVAGMQSMSVVLPPTTNPLAYRWHADDDVTDWYHLEPARWVADPGVPDTADADGPEKADVGVLDLAGPVQDRLVNGSVEWLVDDRGACRVRFALHLDEDEHVTGLGERFHALDHRGHALDTVVFEQYKAQGERTYLPVPFAVVVGGPQSWGLHVDTTRRCWFDVGRTQSDQFLVEVAVSADEPNLRVDGFAGSPQEVLRAFLASTGVPAPVPSWTFRPWMSGNEWNTQERVRREVQRSLDEGIPVGAIVIEAWADEATFTCFRDARYVEREDGGPFRLADFTFPDDGAWPDPVGLVEWLHEQGVRVLLWQIPVLPVEVPDDRHGARQLAHDRRALVRHDFAVREVDGTPYHNRGWWFPGGLLPDFTSPDATRWWVDKRRWLVEELGIDGFKTDGGEHPWGDDLRYADGTNGDEANNRYPNRYARAYHDLLADSPRGGVTFSRAGFTGAGTVPCHWAGDEDSTWEAYRASITAGLTAGISGVFAWGWDHGGFSGPIPDAELYLRTAAMAMLCPIMQYHSEYNHHREPSNDRTPWNIAERTGDPSVLTTYRRFTTIRDRLVDYLDEEYHRGCDDGLPLMRTLALHWPQDPRVWDHPMQYLLGSSLLVAPVTEPGVTMWTAWLPDGDWVDVWTGEDVTGGKEVAVVAPLNRIPAWSTAAAADRLVPMFPDDPVPEPGWRRRV